MLRASAKATNAQVDLKAIIDDGAGDGNIPHGALLTAFAEAALGSDESRLKNARARVRGSMSALVHNQQDIPQTEFAFEARR